MSHVEGWQEPQGGGWEQEKGATPEGRDSGIRHPHVGNGILLQLSRPPSRPIFKSGIGANGKSIPYVLIKLQPHYHALPCNVALQLMKPGAGANKSMQEKGLRWWQLSCSFVNL